MIESHALSSRVLMNSRIVPVLSRISIKKKSQNKTRCYTLCRAKNTPTHSFVSRTVNRK